MTMTKSEPAARADARLATSESLRFAFNLVEEIWQLREPPDETANIHVELRVAGTLDEDRLREAICAAVAVHPMARARRVARRVLLRPPLWQVEASARRDILCALTCADTAALAAARVAFYDRLIPLDEAPALRFLLAHRPGGDTLLLNAHHAITDGVGALRLLGSVARAYAGQSDSVPAIDPLAARDIKGVPGAARAPRRPVGDRAFVAPEGGCLGQGFGFLQLQVPPEKAGRLNPRRFEPSATLNDLLLAALHRAIAEWNARHRCACDSIAVYMPVNLRPADWRDELVINHSAGAKVTSTPAERTSARALMAAITQQTRWIKSAPIAAGGLDLPSWTRNLIPHVLAVVCRLMGTRVENTAVLSNLGRLDDLPQFEADAGPVTELAFSPPCGMPMGLSLGVVGTRGGLQVVFRYRRALFDDDAARRFAEAFGEWLFRLGGDEAC